MQFFAEIKPMTITRNQLFQLQAMALTLRADAVPLADMLLRGDKEGFIDRDIRTILRTGFDLRQRPEPPTRVGEAVATIAILDRQCLQGAGAQCVRDEAWATIHECDARDAAEAALQFVADAHRLIADRHGLH